MERGTELHQYVVLFTVSGHVSAPYSICNMFYMDYSLEGIVNDPWEGEGLMSTFDLHQCPCRPVDFINAHVALSILRNAMSLCQF